MKVTETENEICLEDLTEEERSFIEEMIAFWYFRKELRMKSEDEGK